MTGSGRLLSFVQTSQRHLRCAHGRRMRSLPVTGVYRFDWFDETFTYSVVAYHPLHSFRAVIADNLTPGLMP